MKRFASTTFVIVACLFTFAAPSVGTPLQTPPDEQNPWLCYDIHGWERPCTKTEEWVLCKRAAEDSRIQCDRDAAGDLSAAIVCAMRFVADEKACDAEFVGTFWFF